ncbi:MAG: ParB N-terminal domain-containing protein [Gammaproteobacteria bacterium]|nr:ParB N-terminal domain-containing protein [Gammaproteobacteria bacterium]
MEQTKRKIKSFGASFATNSSVKPAEMPIEVGEGTDKWLNSIRGQIDQEQTQTELDDVVDVRAVALELIYINPNNARELDIMPEEIRKHIAILKLPIVAYGDDDDWIEPYSKQLNLLFGTSKKATDCLDLALFAASLKSPKNLMAPICVWREETRFHIIAGERRYLAHIFMGASHALTRIWDTKPNPFDIQILEWQENNDRVDLSVYENISSIRKIISLWQTEHPDEKMTARKLARIITTGHTTAARWLKVAKSNHQALNKALKDREINSIDLAYELSGLSPSKITHYLKRLKKGQTINTETILKEQRSVDAAKDTSPKTTPALKMNTKANTRPVAFIVNTVVDSIDNPELHKLMQKLDFTKTKELTKALNLIIEYIEKETLQ